MRKLKGTIEERRQKAFINSYNNAHRRLWIRDPERISCLKDARRPYEGENKRQKWEYNCKICSNWFKLKEVEVDHIVPVGTYKTSDDRVNFIRNLYCIKSLLRVLCKPCHRGVTYCVKK